MKSKVGKLDVDKLVPTPVEISKQSDVVKSYVVKKEEHNAKIKNIEDKKPNTTKLATKSTLNAIINEVDSEIPFINNLTTNAFLNAKIIEVTVKYLILLARLLLVLLLQLKIKYLVLVIQSKN